jgi:hypothetical protein
MLCSTINRLLLFNVRMEDSRNEPLLMQRWCYGRWGQSWYGTFPKIAHLSRFLGDCSERGGGRACPHDEFGNVQTFFNDPLEVQYHTYYFSANKAPNKIVLSPFSNIVQKKCSHCTIVNIVHLLGEGLAIIEVVQMILLIYNLYGYKCFPAERPSKVKVPPFCQIIC